MLMNSLGRRADKGGLASDSEAASNHKQLSSTGIE